MAGTCKVEDCQRPHWGRGWCDRHYMRWYRQGDPVGPPRPAGRRRLYAVEDIDWDVLPHDTARACLARYLTGDTKADLAAEYGVSTAAITSWLVKSRKVAKKAGGKPLPKGELRRLLHAGWPVEGVAAYFNCSTPHIRNETTRHGLAPVMACRAADWRAEESRRAAERRAGDEDAAEAKRQTRGERDARIVTEYEAGDSIYVLADRHQLDPSGVWRVLRRDGVDTSQRTSRYGAAGRPPAEPVAGVV